MYEFLFDQTYISLFVIALLLFLVMFLWRKVTIIEGNYFLLEKRVNIIKKEGREDLLAKNMERSEAVMNEIFRDSVIEKSCNNLNYECKIPNNIEVQDVQATRTAQDAHNEYNITEDTVCNFRNDTKQYTEDIADIAGIVDIADIAGIVDIVDISINYFNKNEGTQGKPSNKIELIEEHDNVAQIDVPLVTDVTGVIEVTDIEPEVVIVKPIELKISGDICDITDTGSVCSDITFNSEDKSISKRYKNVNIEKLRDECKEKSLNTEGNRAALISRLVDNIKKQK